MASCETSGGMSQALSEVLVTFSHDVLMMLGGPSDSDKKVVAGVTAKEKTENGNWRSF